MNMPPADINFQFRTLWSRYIPFVIRYKQVDIQSNRGQKPNIPPRSRSLKISSKVTSDISTYLPSTLGKTIRTTFRQDSLEIPISTPIHDRYIPQNLISIPHPQTFTYEPRMRQRSTFTHSKMLSVARNTFLAYQKW